MRHSEGGKGKRLSDLRTNELLLKAPFVPVSGLQFSTSVHCTFKELTLITLLYNRFQSLPLGNSGNSYLRPYFIIKER